MFLCFTQPTKFPNKLLFTFLVFYWIHLYGKTSCCFYTDIIEDSPLFFWNRCFSIIHQMASIIIRKINLFNGNIAISKWRLMLFDKKCFDWLDNGSHQNYYSFWLHLMSYNICKCTLLPCKKIMKKTGSSWRMMVQHILIHETEDFLHLVCGDEHLDICHVFKSTAAMLFSRVIA